MPSVDYKRKKLEYSYDLFKAHKFFKKARAVVVHEGHVLLIEVTYVSGNTSDLVKNDNRKAGNKHYLLPGGGVDEGETIKQAVAREALEEYGVKVKPVQYLGKSYYTVPMNIDGFDFKSNRVEYYYLCKLESANELEQFGLDGEFEEKGKLYKKVKLSLSEIKKLDPSDINDMKNEVYEKLIEYLKNAK